MFVYKEKLVVVVFAVPSKQLQSSTFVSVLLTNHYYISLLIYFYCTLLLVSTTSLLLCSNISISPDQRKTKGL
jgi:hypothetical protein